MPRLRHLSLLLVAFAVARAGDDPAAVLTLRRAGAAPVAFSAAEFAALPHAEVTLVNPHDQKEHRFSGVSVRELLARLDAPLGEKLRGAALQTGVLVRSKDGYAVLFALAEFDESFSSRTLILVDRIDGQPLPATAAPLQLIAPGDKKAARWARMVTAIELISTAPPAPKP
jgi:hypothetical protein